MRRCSLLDGLHRRLVIGKQQVDATLHHRLGGGGQGGYVTLRKSDPDHEVLILTVAQVDQTFDEAIEPAGRPPGRRKHADADRSVQGERRSGVPQHQSAQAAVAHRPRPRPWDLRRDPCTTVPPIHHPRFADAT